MRSVFYTMLILSLAVVLPRQVEGGVISIPEISLEPEAGSNFSAGESASYDVFLRNFIADSPLDSILSFGLNVAASSSDLTAGGTDFSRFMFTLDSGLFDIIGGLPFDDDISDDGRVEYGTDFFLGETGILGSTGDVRLGTLSIVAPTQLDTFQVALGADPNDPFGGGTFLLVDDGTLFGTTLPRDAPMTTTSTTLTVETSSSVVPEPSACATWIGLVLVAAFLRRRNRKRQLSVLG